MFARAAIFLTLLFSAGVALAGWQSGPLGNAGSSGWRQEAAGQEAPAIVPASLAQRPEPVEPAKARPMPKPEVVTLIRQGNKLMREGDIIGARAAYREAAVFGDPAAALVMGRSYDPIYFARIAKRNAEPDPAKAFEWYGLARDSGAFQTAVVRIEDLKRFMAK